MNRLKNLTQVMLAYKEELFTCLSTKKAQDTWNQTSTALIRYVIPGWGFPLPEGKKITLAQKEGADSFLALISVKLFLDDALNAQEKAFRLQSTSKSSQYSYRCALKKLLSWCQEQSVCSKNKKKRNDCIPFKVRRGYGRVTDNPVIYRSNLGEYGLKKSQLTPRLKSELAEFYKFRTQKYYPNRVDKAVREKSYQTQYINLLLILGWFVNVLGEEIESITLESLVPRLPADASREQLEEVVVMVDSWLCDFISFLETERQILSQATIQSHLALVLALAKFHFLAFNQDDNYVQVPLMKMIRSRMNHISRELKNQGSVADMSKKWMDLPIFIEEVVEPLRLMCRPRKNCGDLRSNSAVVWSLVGYLIVGNLIYLPPRRQQELRDLRLALSCPVKRPQNLSADSLIHPLPLNRNVGKNRQYGFFYRNAEGIWMRDMTPESYKTGATYGHQVLEIPNVSFPDGYCFYDYLEMWLYGYYYGSDGNLRSTGNGFDPTSSNLPRIKEARSLFNPDHDFVFCRKNGKNFQAASLGKFFTNLCHRLTGIRVTPHLTRDMFATHFLEQGGTDDLIHSLAYAMAHSVETLRKIYDRRRPAQKRRPIEKAVVDLVQQSLTK